MSKEVAMVRVELCGGPACGSRVMVAQAQVRVAVRCKMTGRRWLYVWAHRSVDEGRVWVMKFQEEILETK